jgi:hypothetical protein
MQQEKQSIFSHEYPPNHTTEIPSNALLNVIHFCRKVLDKEVTIGIPYVYPKSVLPIKNLKGGLDKIDIEWAVYEEADKKAFFNSMGEAIPFMTELSVIAEQIDEAFSKTHKSNIDKGFAKERIQLNKEASNEQVSSILAGGNKGKK